MKCRTALAPVLLGILIVLVVAPAGVAAFRASQVPNGTSVIPNEQALIDAGLSGTPAAGQPRSPVEVERVTVDDAHIYAQYRTHETPRASALYAIGFLDDHGRLLNAGVGGTCRPDSMWAALPPWFPWHPEPRTRCAAELDLVLPASLRGVHVVLGAGAQEDVWVPLRLDALRQFRTTHPSLTATAGGVTVHLTELTNGPLGGHVTLTATPWLGFLQRLSLVTDDGRRLPVRTMTAGCDNVCSETGTFSALPHGAHVVLTAGRPDNGQQTIYGALQFGLVMP